MAIAKGSKSKLIWAEETTFGTAPGGVYKGLSFGSETLVENINKVISDEIRSDRTVPAIRGGNIGTGGAINTDFAADRHVRWLTHLLAATTTVVARSAVSGGAATPGGYTGGTAIPLAIVSTAYTRGQYVENIAANGIYLCVQGGTTAGSGDLSSTSGYETWGTAVFEYAAAASTGVIYVYTITPGVDYPTGGLSIEKQVLGQTSPLYVLFSGCRLDTLGLTIPTEGISKAAWGIVGLKSTKESATDSASITAVVDDPFTGFEAFFSVNSGQTARPVQQGNINITNNVDANVYAWGSRFRRDVPGNRREINGQITTYFEDHVDYDAFKNETIRAVDLSLHRLGKYFNFNFQETKLTGTGTPQIGGQGVITSQFNLDAFKQTGSADVIVTVCTTTAGLHAA